MTARTTLAINAGSSSVKCALFTFEAEPRALRRETIDAAGSSSAPRLFDWIDAHVPRDSLQAIGHRIVHGGPDHVQPQVVTDTLLHDLETLIPFAPNHLPDAIALMQSIGDRQPQVPQVACFDTAFHAALPERTRYLPIPRAYAEQGLRRYGFHGLSYEFLVRELERIAGPEAASGKVILAHLGNGSSLAALGNRRSLDTTMGFTPIGGVVMSTRSGDLDPGVVTYLARRDGLTPEQVEHLLSHESGLLGLSGVSGDMRVLLEREPHDARCRLAVDVFVYSVTTAIGALAAGLGGLETLVFAGGIGEHAPVLRARICNGLEFIGIQLEASRNDANAAVISSTHSRVAVRVIPTDEEITIARAAFNTVSSH